MLLAVTLFAGGLAGFLLWRGEAPLARGVSRLDHRAMAIGVIGFVAALTAIGTGPWGSWVLLLGTLIGLIPPLVGVRRAQCMGFFLVPVMLFYSGYQGAIVSALGLEAKFTPPLPMGAGPVAIVAPDGAECPAEAPPGALEVNRCLVARGSAWAYRTRPEYQEEQAKAARSRAGLWREDAPEPPWEWRRR